MSDNQNAIEIKEHDSAYHVKKVSNFVLGAGNGLVRQKESPTEHYKFSDMDTSGDPDYFGFVDADGGWYIMQLNSSGTARYVKGTSGYTTAWTGKSGLSYDYFYNIF